MLQTLTLLLALAPPAVPIPTDWPAPDLAGSYCSQLRVRGGGVRGGGCCLGRMDECAIPLLGTLCYCDSFCNRTLNSDCCPDYFSHCHGGPLTLVAPAEGYAHPRQGCFYNSRLYNESEQTRENCNDCQCVKVGSRLEMLCSREKCLVEPDSVLLVNERSLGWTAANYSQFWGRTLESGVAMRLGTLQPSEAVLAMIPIRRDAVAGELPRSFDTRDRWPGMVSGVQDQGWCGASWALSTTAIATDRFAIMSMGVERPRPHLSAQHLLDCNNNRQQHGCLGGHLDRAWYFTRKFGLVPESCYPWKGESSKCRVPKKATLQTARCPLRPARSPKARTELYRMGPAYRLAGESDIMKDIIMSGPVQATMQVFPELFSYRGGIYRHIALAEQERSGFHSVRIMGWGDENGEKYWLVANSWGEWWGENGLFRIRRGVNECGIEDLVLAAWAYTHVDLHPNDVPDSAGAGIAEQNPLLDNTIGAF